MRAVQIRAPAALETLELVEISEPPEPEPGEIQVRIRASSLNYHDLHVVSGGYAPDGRIPMSDASGEILAIGEGVSEFAVGDHVVSTFFPDWTAGYIIDAGFSRTPGDGIDGYAREIVTCPVSHFTKAPNGLSHAEAATLPCAGLTAWRGLIVNGKLKAGDTVLVQGTGGVSIFSLQIAKAMGAKVIATSSSDEKLQKLHALGADHLINYIAEPRWGREVRALTEGRGVDHVMEVGGAETLSQSMTAVRAGGQISIIGLLSGAPGSNGSIAQAIARQITLRGLIVGSRQNQLDFFKAVETIGLKPIIDSHFALDNLADAFRHQRSGQHFGKIAIDV